MSEDTTTFLAVLESDLRHIKDLVTAGFAEQKADVCEVKHKLADLNGTVREHDKALTVHNTKIESLERFKDQATSALFRGLGTGLGIAVVAGGILFGIGKAIGWW